MQKNSIVQILGDYPVHCESIDMVYCRYGFYSVKNTWSTACIVKNKSYEGDWMIQKKYLSLVRS